MTSYSGTGDRGDEEDDRVDHVLEVDRNPDQGEGKGHERVDLPRAVP